MLDNQTNNGQHKYAYTYDYVGNRLEMTVTSPGGVGIHLYSYDNIYQITEVNYPDSLSYLATDTEFNYDAAGNRTRVIDGSGTCNYTSNNLNQYTAAGPTNFSYDSSGNMTHDANYGYAYDPENRLIQVTKSGGPTDLAAALDSFLTYTTGGAASWAPVGGAYAQSGYINHNQESWMQAQVEGPGTLTFQWKVSSEAGCDQLQFYLDDELQDAIDGEQDWDEISYQVTGSGTHTFRWRYQKDYSVSEGEDAGYVDQVQWTGPLPEDPPTDRWHHLTYVYDAAGRRIEKQYDYDTVLKYVYDGDHCLAEYDAGGNLRRKYIYGPAVDEPICMIESTGSYGGTYYYHFDALGSVTALTNADANAVQVYEYDVYGRVGMLDANHPNRFLFTGREYDKETGLYYYRARYYNPQIGRFLQTDPIGYGDGMNWYAYCRNNSLNRVDPSGMVGQFLDSEDGLLRYEAEDGTITTFAGETALQQWMDWYASDLKSRGILWSELVGHKMAGGDTDLNIELLMTLQAMIAFGYDADKIRFAEADGKDGTKGARIQLNTNGRNEYSEWDKVAYWDPHNQANYPGMMILAHEVEHAWQDATGQMAPYRSADGQWIYNVEGSPLRAKLEEAAMIPMNAIAYAFYKKVPGYGKGERYETPGPYTSYAADGKSIMTGEFVPMLGMSWEEYERRPGFTPKY